MRAQGIGAYGSVGGNGRNGGHRSSGASNIVNPSFSGDPPASKIAALARKDFGAHIGPSQPKFLHFQSRKPCDHPNLFATVKILES